MHPGHMISKVESEWEDVLQTNKAVEILQKLREKFPQYDFRRAGSQFSYRNPLAIQVARGLSDNEFHVILGYCKACEDLL